MESPPPLPPGDAARAGPSEQVVVVSKDATEAGDGAQVALITGSASGIGRGTARAFAALNYRLALVDKRADRLAETGAQCFECSPRKLKVSVQA